MKLLFSEAVPDPAHYVYPYAVWGFLEEGETPATAFAAGFLPSSPDLDRFYLVRQVRVPLPGWKPNSENRRILRKLADTQLQLLPRHEWRELPGDRLRWLAWAEQSFGPGVMHQQRLDRLMSSPVVSHILRLIETASGRELAVALLYLEPPAVAYYYYAFYDTSPEWRHLGIGLMTRAVEQFSAHGFRHLHLGTCYTESSLYKTQFDGVEFFNGLSWSNQLPELKHLVRTSLQGCHRLETPEFVAFQNAPLNELARASPFRIGTDPVSLAT
jgi:arginyl-tRNA--protein-N-Asp/Glu arginylyltransferase